MMGMDVSDAWVWRKSICFPYNFLGDFLCQKTVALPFVGDLFTTRDQSETPAYSAKWHSLDQVLQENVSLGRPWCKVDCNGGGMEG